MAERVLATASEQLVRPAHAHMLCAHLATWNVLLNLAQQHGTTLALLSGQRDVWKAEDGLHQAAHCQCSVAAADAEWGAMSKVP